MSEVTEAKRMVGKKSLKDFKTTYNRKDRRAAKSLLNSGQYDLHYNKNSGFGKLHIS